MADLINLDQARVQKLVHDARNDPPIAELRLTLHPIREEGGQIVQVAAHGRLRYEGDRISEREAEIWLAQRALQFVDQVRAEHGWIPSTTGQK
ncbi:MAG: hypothetical protein AAFV53_16505 [Myxococcota bacterium]